MATNVTATPTVQPDEFGENRTSRADKISWMRFAYHSFGRIVARKHNLAVPDLPDNIPEEDLEIRLNLVRDLAHLPPA